MKKNYSIVCLLQTFKNFVLLFALTFFAFAQTVSAQPAYSRGEQRLPITYEVAMQRAKAALIAEGRMDQPGSGSTAVNNPPSNISGTWIVKQGPLTGILTLFQSGTTLSGTIDWDGHDDGTIKTGSYIDGKVVFVLSYPSRYEGTYNALVDNSGKMTNGTTSSTQGSTASWTAIKN